MNIFHCRFSAQIIFWQLSYDFFVGEEIAVDTIIAITSTIFIVIIAISLPIIPHLLPPLLQLPLLPPPLLHSLPQPLLPLPDLICLEAVNTRGPDSHWLTFSGGIKFFRPSNWAPAIPSGSAGVSPSLGTLWSRLRPCNPIIRTPPWSMVVLGQCFTLETHANYNISEYSLITQRSWLSNKIDYY